MILGLFIIMCSEHTQELLPDSWYSRQNLLSRLEGAVATVGWYIGLQLSLLCLGTIIIVHAEYQKKLGFQNLIPLTGNVGLAKGEFFSRHHLYLSAPQQEGVRSG